MAEDPHEVTQRLRSDPEVAAQLHARALMALQTPNCIAAHDGDRLRAFPFQARAPMRIYQFANDRGAYGFSRQ